MKKYLEYLPAILISIITLRASIFGASIGDAISVLSLSGLYGYKQWLDKQEVVDPTEEIKKEIEEIRGEIGKVSIAVIQKTKPAAGPAFRF